MKKILLIGLAFGLSSCANPFNLKALNDLASTVPFFGTTSVSIVAGATQTAITGSGYKTSTNVGNFVNQPGVVTGSGYKVYSTLQSTQ